MPLEPLDVDGFKFIFPDGWTRTKPDDWTFYRKHFIKICKGIKSVDVIAVEPPSTLWLIEAKDYRVNRRTKTIDIVDETAQKVLATLALLLPAKINATDPGESSAARQAVGTSELRIVLHLEQPKRQSKLFPRDFEPANVKIKLRKLIKPIDAHALVTEMTAMHGVPWTVR